MGQEVRRANIVAISNAFPCVVETEEAHEFDDLSFVTFTNLNGAMPIPRGMDPINFHRFRIKVLTETTFKIQDQITHKDIDSTEYPPYVSGGFATMSQTNFDYLDDDDA